MRYRSKDVRAMCSSSFDTVSVVDASFTSFVVDIKVLEVVIEVHASCAEISPQQGSVGRKDSCDVDMSLADCERRESTYISACLAILGCFCEALTDRNGSTS